MGGLCERKRVHIWRMMVRVPSAVPADRPSGPWGPSAAMPTGSPADLCILILNLSYFSQAHWEGAHRKYKRNIYRLNEL